ncbi:MAG: bifunctional methionine sulfoxide reductase B/A protein [Candidatus Delongbacteria bacterium]|nr:bifunctional methionine sulfoxide reductase B/A protein [Candidatus Delongbacteria bacterium]
MKYRELTPEEERVILHKGTEAPFSGVYNDYQEEGTYICKRCSTPLYVSGDKFDSHCGWPSFDDAIPGAVLNQPDADGQRTEILCNKCGAHLGHVFNGEQLTDKNTRYCVNSISMDFLPAKAPQPQTAVFAGGCFWGVEYYFEQVEGVLTTRVGYIGGDLEHPEYGQVSSGTTGHAEALEVTFDPTLTSFEQLARLFFEIHDPTQVDRQGPDIGTQYRSAIFYQDEEQRKTANKLISLLRGKGYEIATQLHPATDFWEAESYHQDYYQVTGKQPYCHVYTKRF